MTRARNSFDGPVKSRDASRGGQASKNRPSKKSERQLVPRADARSGLRTAARKSKPGRAGSVDKRQRGLIAAEEMMGKLLGSTELVEGTTARFAGAPPPPKTSYARSGSTRNKIGPGGGTRRVHELQREAQAALQRSNVAILKISGYIAQLMEQLLTPQERKVFKKRFKLC